MDPTEGSETSAHINQTLGIHPKVETVNNEHSESLKSRSTMSYDFITAFIKASHCTLFFDRGNSFISSQPTS
jgi:hypothetical protein